jgi:tape measure domain-containing protein
MAGISTSVRVNDGLSAAFRTMTQSINICLSSFVEMQEATGQGVNISSINAARASLNNMTVAASQVENEIAQAGNKQQQFNNEVVKGNSAMSGLVGKAVGLVGAYASIQGIKGIAGLSDTMAQTTARLSMMNYGLQTTEELNNMIYESAQRSRASYLDTANTVAQLGNRARDAFSSNQEVVAFSETLNKMFTIAGAGQQEMSSASLQLTQALGSGILRGEEFNAVFEAAPNVMQAVADYMDVPIGQLKNMASEGQITADIVKNALLDATDEVNTKFATMPMTWGQVATSMQNQALRIFDPILTKINELANNEKFQTMTDEIMNGLIAVSSAATRVFDVMGAGATWVYDNWSDIAPVVGGVAFAIGAYYGILAFGAIVQGAAAFAMSAYHIGCAIAAFSVGNLAVAQAELNMAMLANPILLIVSIIIGVLIFALVQWIQKVGDLKLAWLIAMDAIKTKIETVHVALVTAGNAILNTLDLWGVAFQMVGVLIANHVGNMKVNVLTLLQNMINGSIELINSFLQTLNKIPGVNIDLISTVSTIGTDAAAAEAENQASRWANVQASYANAQNSKIERAADLASLQSKYADNQAARQLEISQRRTEVASGANDTSATDSAFDSIANSSGATAANTSDIADSMEITDEDLKYLRDIAEREIIDRTVFQSLRVDMGGVSNTVNNMADLDGIADYLGDVISQTASASMEG